MNELSVIKVFWVEKYANSVYHRYEMAFNGKTFEVRVKVWQ